MSTDLKRGNEIGGTPVFTRQHFDDLQRARRELNDLIREFDRAEYCGYDCSSLRAIAAQMDEQFARIEEVYMTPAPR